MADEQFEESLSFLETVLQNADIIEDQEAASYLAWLDRLFLQFHNTDLNPQRLNLYDFSVAKIIKMRFFVPTNDLTVALPPAISLLHFYLKRNGKEELFAVQNCQREPANAMRTIANTFK